MSGNTNLERLLPTLCDFLCGEPLSSPALGRFFGQTSEGGSSSSSSIRHASGSSSPHATRQTHAGLPPSPACLASYERWRRCIGVWRKVIGNDSLFLTLLLHAGCLWAPDYAALYRARREVHARAQRPHYDSAMVKSDGVHANGTPVRESGGSLMEWMAATTTTTVTKGAPAAASVSQPSVRRRGRRGGNNVAEGAAQSASALASAAELHAGLAAACPASLWALHTLHFLRVEEVYVMPAEAAVASSYASTSRGTESSGDDDGSSSTSNDIHSDSDSASSANSISGDRSEDGTSVGGRGGRRRGGGAGVMRQGVKRRHTAGRRRRPAQEDFSGGGGGGVRRKRQRAQDRDGGDTSASLSLPGRQLAASSALLLSVPRGEKSWAGPAARSAVPAVLLERELRRRRIAHTTSTSRTCEDGGDGDDAAAAAALHAAAAASAERTHGLLLRAMVTLISEEEPLVQRVASSLVEEWLRLMSAEVLPSSHSDRGTEAQTGVKEEKGGSAAPSPLSTASDEDVAGYGDAVREARDYWFSCALKLVAYLDGVHSALREENAHIAAVLARQGIAPQDAEGIFTKSIPAIFNCVLVEEALGSAAATTHAAAPSSSPSQGPAPAPLQLRMPPPVLLLPFHLLAQGSQFGVWVPASRDSSVPRSAARAQGRFVACTVESHGLQCDAARRVWGTRAARPGRRLGFAVRCTEPQDRLETGTAAALDLALPREAATDAEGESVPVRWWACTQRRTCGAARVDLYVARTLLMLPIPAQSTLDSTTAAHPTRATAGTSGSGSSTAIGTEDSRTTGHAAGSAAASSATGAAVEDGRRGRRGAARRRPAEEVEVRRRQPSLYYAMHPHLRISSSASHTSSSTAATATTAAAAELVLLYGVAWGEEATLLRQLGFVVRTGSHHGLGRSGGSAGGAGISATVRRAGSSASTAASAAGAAPASGGFNGRLTMARDALGTTLDGVHRVARRVLALHGVFVSPAAGSGLEGTGKGPRGGVRDAGRATSFSAKGSAAQVEESSRSLAGGAAHVSTQTEREALGTVAATLALTCLTLSHSLVDELLEQPSLVLWSAELASFVLDVSLLMPRPVPRLMKADGFALALLLQNAQSLLLLVGLAATLVTREARLDTPSNSGGMPGRGRAANTGGGVWPAEETWHPWWSTFRAAVLRDAELPSRLYPGVWAIAENAEAALAAVATRASASAARPLGLICGGGGGRVFSASRGGRRGTAGGGGARRVLSLITSAAAPPTASGTSTLETAAPTASSIPRHHRLLHVGAAPPTAPSAAAMVGASPPPQDGPSAVTEAEPLRYLCGPAVVRHAGVDAREAPPSADACVRVVPAMDVALLEAHMAPRALQLVSHTACTASGSRLRSAVASALWLALEAEGMHWPICGSVAT